TRRWPPSGSSRDDSLGGLRLQYGRGFSTDRRRTPDPDRSGVSQDVQPDGGGAGAELYGDAGADPGFAGAQWGGEDDDHAGDLRDHSADLWEADGGGARRREGAGEGQARAGVRAGR